MKEVLTINGNLYVTANHGSSLVDYTSDYIGQLAREGHVASEKIGRTLYVDQYELIRYAEKKNALTSSGKKDIKKPGPKPKKQDTISISVSDEVEIANSTPISYEKESHVNHVAIHKSSKSPSTKPSIASLDTGSSKIVAPVEMFATDKPKSSSPATVSSSHREDDNMPRKGRGMRSGDKKAVSTRVKVVMVILTLCTLGMVSGVFVENIVVYEINEIGFIELEGSFGVNGETFFDALGYLRQKFM